MSARVRRLREIPTLSIEEERRRLRELEATEEERERREAEAFEKGVPLEEEEYVPEEERLEKIPRAEPLIHWVPNRNIPSRVSRVIPLDGKLEVCVEREHTMVAKDPKTLRAIGHDYRVLENCRVFNESVVACANVAVVEAAEKCELVEDALKCAKIHQDENLTVPLAAGLSRLNETDTQKCVDKLEVEGKIVKEGKKFMGDNPYRPVVT